MKYKIIIAFALFSPIATTSYGNGTDARIQKIKKARFEKQLEISNLGKLILEKNKFIESFITQAYEFKTMLIHKRKRMLTEKKHVSSLSNEETHNIEAEIQESFDICEEYVKTTFLEKRDFKGKFFKHVFNAEIERFDMYRIALVVLHYENRLMDEYLEQYENLIQELVEIETLLETPAI